MPNGKEEKLFAEDDLSLSYYTRREFPADVIREDWFKREARKKMGTEPSEQTIELRKIFAERARELIADGYDMHDVEAEWGLTSGLRMPAYEPADLIADIASGFGRTAGRQAIGLARKGIQKGEKEVVKGAAKALGREVGEEVGFGAVAGASMFFAEEMGAGPVVEMMSGLIGPTATAGMLTLTRKGFATWLRRLKNNNRGMYDKIITAADDLPDNEFARLVKEIEAPGGAPWKPEVSPGEYTVTVKSQKGTPKIIELADGRQIGVYEGGILAIKDPKTGVATEIAKTELRASDWDKKGLGSKEFKQIEESLGIELKEKLPEPEPPKIKKKLKEPSPEEIKTKEFEAKWLEVVGDVEQPIIQVGKKKQELILTWEAAKVIDPSERAININLSKFNTVDDIKEAVAKIAKLFPAEIQEARRGKVLWKETGKMADLLGLTPDEFVKRQRGEALNATELKAAQKLLINTAAIVSDLGKKATSPIATEVDKFAFRRGFNTLYAVQAHYSGAVAEAGRALNILKSEATGSAQRAREIKDMLFTMEGAIPIEKQAAMIAALDSPQALTVTVKKAYKANTWDMFFEAWINGLLTGPQTHAVNTGSTGLFSLWQIPERYIAASISRIMPGPQEIKTGEANALLWGMIEGFKDGVKIAGKTFKTGEALEEWGKLEMRRIPSITAANMNLDPAGPFGRGVDILGEFIRSPTVRGLMAEDDLFKATLYRAELEAQAYRQATFEGLEGLDFAKRRVEIISDPPENIKVAAMNFARYGTFQEPLGEMGKSIQQALGKCPPARLIVPFFRTGSNLAKTFHERTPTYPITSAFPILWGKSSKFWGEIAAGGARRDLALGKVSLGSMFMAVAATWAAQGYITGGGPLEPKARAAKRRMGWQSYSFCTNPGAPFEERNYTKFSRIDPFGFSLGTAADMVEIMGNVDQMTSDEIAATGVIAFSENVTSKTWIRGFSDFNEAYSDPKRYMTKYLQRMAGTLVPTGIATVERVIDPTFREVDSWLDQVKSRIPGLSKTLPPRLDRWAEPMIGGTIRGEEGSWFWLPVDLINPLYVSKGKRSPIDKEAYEQGFSLPPPSRIIEGVELHDDEYHRYQQLEAKIIRDERTGKNLKETLDFIIEHPAKAQALGITALRYDKRSDGPEGDKAVTIKRIIQQFRNMAQLQLRAEFPDLDRLIDDLRKEKMEEVEAMAGGMQ